MLNTYNLAPMDLIWYAVDENGIPKNPKWGAQIINPGSLPNPLLLCPTGFGPPCTTQSTSEDSGAFCGPHVNWFAATYEGAIFWHDHDSFDDDYNFRLSTPDQAGVTAVNPQGLLMLEFDSDETIDHFHTPFWNEFHQAVDESDEAAGSLVNRKFAIVTGLMGLDVPHNAWSELHPVWAMAIHYRDDPSNDVWAIFVRNWGNEGFCSDSQHFLYLPNNRYTFRLPWRPGMSSVSVLNQPNDRLFLTNDARVIGPDVIPLPGEGVLVSFTLPEPGAGAQVNGELHLQWSP